jgi:hypothetical protein
MIGDGRVLTHPVAATRVHHSEGMASRFQHLITDQFVVPTSAAVASREGHRPMTARNDVSVESESVMNKFLGQFVPKFKAHLSHDLISPMRQCVPMADDDVEDIAESQWRDAFRARVREAQGDRKDKDMAKLLGITPERYRKYVGGGASRKTVIPVRLLTRFCLITDRALEWLIDGPEEQINKQQKPRKTQPSMKRRATAPRR